MGGVTSSIHEAHKPRPQRKAGCHTQMSSSDLDRPLIFPGKILHTRIFPQHHSFTFPYLMVWIPLHSDQGGNGILSTENGSHDCTGWLQVRAEDHLHREDNDCGLRHKLEVYLKTQSVELSDFSYYYLVTAPRLLNHKFSPASFWLLYTADRVLKVVIAEVNNTFDERRMYVRFADSGMNDAGGTFRVADQKSTDFQSYWPKDFHVSPFSSRKGFYHLSVRDPLEHYPTSGNEETSSNAKLDIRPVLYSSKGNKKLVTRLWSVGEPIDPTTISRIRFATFMLSWWWVGLVTYPRILHQAVLLAYRRGLSIWYLPEPRTTTVPRRASADEISISKVFSKYLCSTFLRHKGVSLLWHKSTEGTSEHQFLIPNDSVAPVFFAEAKRAPPETPSVLTIRVTTPEFYTRLASYRSLEDFLHTEILSPGAEENQAIVVSSLAKFASILRRTTDTSKEAAGYEARGDASLPVLDQLEWRVLAALRPRNPVPAGWYPYRGNPHMRDKEPAHPCDAPSSHGSRQPSQPSQPSFLDEFVRYHVNKQECHAYRRAVIRMSAARRWAGGSELILRSYGWFLLLLTGAVVGRIVMFSIKQ